MWRYIFRPREWRPHGGTMRQARFGFYGTFGIKLRYYRVLASYLLSKPYTRYTEMRERRRAFRQTEYAAYDISSEVDRRTIRRGIVLQNWRLTLGLGCVILLGYFVLGLLLDSAPMDQESSIKGVHFAAAGVLLAVGVWSWPLVRLRYFLRGYRRRFDGTIADQVEEYLRQQNSL